MTIRAAMYLRISLDHTGEGLAVERQEAECRKVIAERGWELVDVYRDNSLSASKSSVVRPEYERMLADYRRGRFNAIVCWDLDRLTRQPRQLEEWIDLAERHGLYLATVNSQQDMTKIEGRLFARIKANVARYEVEQKGLRQKAAAKQRAEKGGWTPGAKLTGYDKRGAVIPVEAEFVRSLFERFYAGETLAGMARDFTERGIPTQRGGERWHSSSILTMLRNPRYAGRQIYLGSVVGEEANWDAIVPAELFDAVQIKLSDPRRKTNKTGTERKYLGSGIYLCAECERPMQTYGKTYACPEMHLTRTMPAIDEWVRRVVVNRLASGEMVGAVDDSKADQAEELDRQIQAERARIERFENDYFDGAIEAAVFNRAVDKARAAIAKITDERIQLLAAGPLSKLLGSNDPAQDFLDSTVAVQRTIIDALLIVRLHRWPRGKKGFTTDSVSIEFRS